MTYTLLSLPFLIASLAVWWVRTDRRAKTVTGAVMAVVLVLTVIFDNLMVGAGFVGYDEGNNLGLYLGLIPVEDLYYSVFVVLVVAAWWPPVVDKRGGA